MRIRMLKTRRFVVPEDRRVTFKYKEGCRYTVKRDWGDEMVAAGEAQEVKTAAARPAAPPANAVRTTRTRAPRKSRRKDAV